MNIDLTFSLTYIVNTDVWLPSSAGVMPVYFYPEASRVRGQDGILLEIAPEAGTPWMGMFANGRDCHLSGIYACPDEETLCVISLGRCYFVKASDPLQWREKAEQIAEARILPDHPMLILGEEESMVAYGAHGFLWRTESLGNGPRLEAVEEKRLLVNATTHRGEKRYAIRLLTGEIESGY